MAFWGAPLDDPQHADHAVEAAIAMQDEARRLSADFVMRGLPPLAIGVGVNTGLARVGDMGSAVRRTYTALGDAVNLASRLEGLTKRYEMPIIVGEATASAARAHRFGELRPANVDGRSEPVRVFVPLMENGQPMPGRQHQPPAPVPAANNTGSGIVASKPKHHPSGAVDEGTGPRV
jgi:adenylate cyclase